MSLIAILLVTVAIMSFAFGVLILIGSSKSDRLSSAWFCLATLASAVWAISMAIFLTLSPTARDADVIIHGIYIAPTIMMVGLLGYVSWRYRSGKVLTIINLLMMMGLVAVMMMDHSLLYQSYTLSSMGNVVNLTNDWFYYVYTAFFFVADGTFLLYAWHTIRHTRNKHLKTGTIFLMVGFAVTGGVTLLFDLVLPMLGIYSLIWIGALFISVTIAMYFYSVLRYHMISVASRWLQVATYAVVSLTGVAVYMLLFYTVFTALFKIPNPSTAVLVLNFIMIVIVLLLMPVIREVNAVLRSMIMVGQVDITYVIRKLNKLATRNVDLRELASFLAEHLHFAYVGFIINGKLYSSKPLAVSAEDLAHITKMRPAASNGVWQEPNKTTQEILNSLNLKAVAELRNAKGKAFGQLLVGRPVGKTNFERRDLIQLEMIINLVATVIDSEKHIRA